MSSNVWVSAGSQGQRLCRGTCEQHASGEHLSQYAASSPHVYGLGVVIGGQKETGGTVPLCYQTLGQIALGEEVKETIKAYGIRKITVVTNNDKHAANKCTEEWQCFFNAVVMKATTKTSCYISCMKTTPRSQIHTAVEKSLRAASEFRRTFDPPAVWQHVLSLAPRWQGSCLLL